MTFCGTRLLPMAALAVVLAPALALAREPAGSPRYAPDVPAGITTPGSVESPIGPLRFRDGAPDPATVQRAYDQLDFGRGIEAFLRGMSATSVHAICRGLEQAGVVRNRASASARTCSMPAPSSSRPTPPRCM
jgi:hypothetical protein